MPIFHHFQPNTARVQVKGKMGSKKKKIGFWTLQPIRAVAFRLGVMNLHDTPGAMIPLSKGILVSCILRQLRNGVVTRVVFVLSVH